MYQIFLGCYTEQNINSDAIRSEGIYLLTISEEGKLLGAPRLLDKQVSPSYFYLTKDKNILYAVGEPSSSKGFIAAYHVNEKDGSLTLFSYRKAAGAGLCHVVLDPAERNLLATCYPDATVQVYPLSEDGSITPMFCLRRHVGSGPNLERQEKAHAHCATFSPDGKYVVECDLGTDTLYMYVLIPEMGKLHRAYGKNVQMPPGCGPRHLIFSPDGRFAYVTCELSSEVAVLSYDGDGGLTILGLLSTLSAGFSSTNNYPSAIRLSKDGRHLYLSNRGEDTIALFNVDRESGMLSPVENVSTKGWYPRDFILTEDEKFVIAVNQLSDNLIIYRRDEESGRLTETDEKTIIQKPIALMEL